MEYEENSYPLLLGTLVFLIKVGLADLRLHFVGKSDCDICSVDHVAHCERYQSIVLSSIPNNRVGSFVLSCGSSQRIFRFCLVHACDLSNSGEMHGRKAF